MQTYFVVNVDYIHAFKLEFSDGEFFNNPFFCQDIPTKKNSYSVITVISHA